MRSVLFKIRSSPEFDLVVVVTGMHLMAEFGNSVDEIINDGFTITRIDIFPEKDQGMLRRSSLENFLRCYPGNYKSTSRTSSCSWATGARCLPERLQAPISAYLLHISTGEKYPPLSMNRSGMPLQSSNIHMAATQKSAERIIRMGEDPRHVYMVGAPGLAAIIGKTIPPEGTEEEIPGLDPENRSLSVSSTRYPRRWRLHRNRCERLSRRSGKLAAGLSSFSRMPMQGDRE